MLVYEAGGIVDVVMDNNKQILLSCVLGDLGVRVYLVGRHDCQILKFLVRVYVGRFEGGLGS